MTIRRHVLYGFASLTAWYAGAGHALGLGDLSLHSALNQPLLARIQLHDSEGLRPADVKVALADAESFSRLGLARPLFLGDLRFTPVMENRQLVIRVESASPVNEPYLSFVLQLTQANGSLLREYTLLLDPPLYQPAPVLASTQAGTAAPGGQASSPAAVRSSSRATAIPSGPAPGALSPAPPRPGAGRYWTVAGDSLWSIAVATREDTRVSVQRQMDAIVALNRHAFVNGDPRRLRIGQELVLPASGQAPVASDASAQSATESEGQQAPLAAVPGNDRLRLDEPQQPLNDELQPFMERLVIAENQLRRLLGELELRDAQIADLERELERVRQAGAIESLARAGALDLAGHTAERLPDSAAAAVTDQQQAAAAGTDSLAHARQPAQPRAGWLARWWPVPAVLLSALLGALFLRSRREAEPAPSPQVGASVLAQPITIPGNRVVDPLEGVELYLAYGRVAEARAMLDRAIADEPQRLDLRMRLLSVCAELDDRQGFARQEQALAALGAEQAQIERVKAHHPDLFGSARRTEPSLGALLEEQAELELANLSLDSSWDLPEEIDRGETDLAAEPRGR